MSFSLIQYTYKCVGRCSSSMRYIGTIGFLGGIIVVWLLYLHPIIQYKIQYYEAEAIRLQTVYRRADVLRSECIVIQNTIDTLKQKAQEQIVIENGLLITIAELAQEAHFSCISCSMDKNKHTIQLSAQAAIQEVLLFLSLLQKTALCVCSLEMHIQHQTEQSVYTITCIFEQ